jgi:hypothetical protein
MTAASPTSSDAAAMDRLNLELLLMMVMIIHSLLRKEGGANDDDDAGELKDMLTEFNNMPIDRRNDQSVMSMKEQLLAVTQRLFDAHRLQGGDENKGVVSSSASDHQLMDSAAAAKKKADVAAAAAAKKKKKRNKRNKAAAKHKGTKFRSWLGGGILSLVMMVAFGFITTFNVALSLIHRSDGSSEGKAPPTLPPSTSTSLRVRGTFN